MVMVIVMEIMIISTCQCLSQVGFPERTSNNSLVWCKRCLSQLIRFAPAILNYIHQGCGDASRRLFHDVRGKRGSFALIEKSTDSNPRVGSGWIRHADSSPSADEVHLGSKSNSANQCGRRISQHHLRQNHHGRSSTGMRQAGVQDQIHVRIRPRSAASVARENAQKNDSPLCSFSSDRSVYYGLRCRARPPDGQPDSNRFRHSRGPPSAPAGKRLPR